MTIKSRKEKEKRLTAFLRGFFGTAFILCFYAGIWLPGETRWQMIATALFSLFLSKSVVWVEA